MFISYGPCYLRLPPSICKNEDETICVINRDQFTFRGKVSRAYWPCAYYGRDPSAFERDAYASTFDAEWNICHANAYRKIFYIPDGCSYQSTINIKYYLI